MGGGTALGTLVCFLGLEDGIFGIGAEFCTSGALGIPNASALSLCFNFGIPPANMSPNCGTGGPLAATVSLDL